MINQNFRKHFLLVKIKNFITLIFKDVLYHLSFFNNNFYYIFIGILKILYFFFGFF